jgi:hypothetical protein
MDHSSVWYHSATKSYVLADEPYETGFNGIPEHRLAWGRKHGWAVAKPNWRGMYSPDGGCVLYLACDRSRGDLLSPIVTALNTLPLPTVAADWQGFSRPLSQRFASPASAKVDPRPSTSKPVRNRGARATVGYRPPFSRTERRRPLARMPIEAHAEVGGLLTRVIAKTRRRRGVYNRLSVVRSKLDDWVQCEYDRTELPDDRFFVLYYGEGSGRGGDVQIGEAPTDRNVTKLEQAKRILAQHYRECGPLQLVLKSIDAAIESLRTWKA